MKIVIDVEDSVAPFAQLITQIKHAVQSDTLLAGDPLPSIRQLANDLNLNHKTVAKAYRLLERDSVIETKGYRGTYVHPQAKANSQIDLTALVTDKLSDAVTTLRDSGVTDSEIRVVFAEVMGSRKH